MIPPAPLADDWLYWDPYAIAAYPHSVDPRDGPDAERDPEQLELFDALETIPLV